MKKTAKLRTGRDARIPRVALMISVSVKSQQDFLAQALEYTRRNRPWMMFRPEGRSGEQPLLDLKSWGCDAIVTTACDARTGAAYAALGVPVFLVEPPPDMRRAPHPLARCSAALLDSENVGRVAARFFLEKGFRFFAYVGEEHGLYWSHERLKGYKDTLAAAGFGCAVYDAARAPRDWARELPRLLAWLRRLPKPAAVFAAMDGRARLVLDACLSGGIPVPDDVAVLGVDNDELLCETCFPPLSSIDVTNPVCNEAIMEHIDALLRNPRARRRRVFVNHAARVVERGSTDTSRLPDSAVVAALRHIRENFALPDLRVDDVVACMGVSRRAAETRFKRVVGHSILAEITRRRLARVTDLLATTRLPVSEITRRVGYTRETYLARLFAKHFRTTMRAWRAAPDTPPPGEPSRVHELRGGRAGDGEAPRRHHSTSVSSCANAR